MAAMEQQMASERLRRKLDEVDKAAEDHLSAVKHHINTLQEKKARRVGNCVKHCTVPVVNAVQVLDEIAKFHKKFNGSLRVCLEKFEAAKLRKIGPAEINSLELCVDQPIQDYVKTLPHLVGRLKASLSINDEAK